MHNHHSNEPVDTSKGYDVTDLSVRDITKGVIWFFVFTAVAGAMGFAFLYVLGRTQAPKGDPYQSRRLPSDPHPFLQTNITAKTDTWNLRAREHSILDHYGWSDRSKGLVHVPIEVAIEQEAQALAGQGGSSTPVDSTVAPMQESQNADPSGGVETTPSGQTSEGVPAQPPISDSPQGGTRL